VALLWVAACGMPEEGGAGSSSGSSEPSSVGPTGVATSLDASTSDASTSTGLEGETSTTTGEGSLESSSSTGPAEVACKDGVAVPGELCLEAEYVYPVGTEPRSLAVGDIDDDGALDLIAGSDNSAAVTILRGVGDGSFGVPETFEGAATRSDFVLLAALDDDALPDLVVIDVDQSMLHAHLNVGGAFQTSVPTDYAITAMDAVAGDLDGDGIDEVTLVAVHSGVTVFDGKGFGSFAPRMSIPVQMNARGVALGDLDQNGWPDIATVDPLDTGDDPRAIEIADFDEDGGVDILAADFASDSLTLRPSDPLGGFGDAITLTADDEPGALHVADLDGDTHLDIVVVHARADAIDIHRGAGDASFAAPVRIEVGDQPSAVVSGDFDRDAVVDLAVVNLRSHDLVVLLSDP
jgi:hypothetical protein